MVTSETDRKWSALLTEYASWADLREWVQCAPVNTLISLMEKTNAFADDV